MYLSKETILKAYDVLSKATPSILNNFSAIQYFVATDRFFKKNGKPCDSSSSKSKAEFYGYVEEVILLDDNNYLSSFKTIYEGSKSVSSTVSSNFFSGSSVEHSNNTSGKRFDYPKKGPLLYALDGKVYKEDTYYENLSDYLKSNEEKFALAIWLLRQCNDFDNTTIEEVRRNLETKYSSLLVNTLIPSNLTDMDYLANTFTIAISEDRPQINKNDISKKDKKNIKFSECINDLKYLAAIRTKPFLLLAGISGTGKSRIVRELAFKSCPEYLQDKDGTTPGNYCMIEVKPNWHDSTELLGYYSNMNKSYQFKKFVKFLVKAKMFPGVPFFVCLDEMNLAPVEHYFAEMLSIMETRKHPKKEGTDEVDKEVIKTGTIVDAQHFREFGGLTDKNGNTYTAQKTDRDIYMKLYGIDTESDIDEEVGKRTDLTTEGLTLPDNVIIIGTVNMDDTTHQFSRKVIDRAMTIEMNGGKLSNMFGGSKDLEYLPKEEQERWQNSFRQPYVNADEVLEAHPNEAENIVKKVPEKLENINKALKGTPFEVSYRVLNELTIMVGVLLDSKEEGENIDGIIDQALDRILLMKILPRIEGDSDMFNLSREFKQENHVEYNNRLEWLMDLAPEIVTEEQECEDHRQTAREKIKEMIDRLDNQEFTRFWP